MSYSLFHIIHLLSVFLLVGACVYAIAAAEDRKKVMMWSGIASLVVFISGFGLLGILKIGFPLWSWFKMASWLGLSVLAGLAYRMQGKKAALLYATFGLVALAVIMVSLKP